MGGSRKVARLAFMWGLVACTGAATAVAQEAVQQKPTAETRAFSIPQSANSINQSFRTQQPATQSSERSAPRAGPWLPQPWQSVRADTKNSVSSLSDNHTIVISTLGLIIVGAVLLLLVL